MKLYSVTNGFLGADAVTVLVIAEDSESAIDQAIIRYKDNGKGLDASYSRKESMQAHLLCDDTSKPWSSTVSDGAHLGEENL